MTLGAGGLYGTDIVGRSTVQPVALSELDAERMALGRTPEAAHPDGYLGTIRSRRDDRLLDAVKERTDQRPYQRGVHKGNQIGAADYYWPQWFTPQTGLMLQKKGKKFAPLEQFAPPQHLPNDGKSDVVANEPGRIDRARAENLARLMPLAR